MRIKLIISVVLLAALSSFSEVSLSLKNGLVFSSIKGGNFRTIRDLEAYEDSLCVGYSGGVSARFRLKHRLSLQPELFIVLKGVQYSYEEGINDEAGELDGIGFYLKSGVAVSNESITGVGYRFTNLDIPVLVRYDFSDKARHSFVYTGPNVSLNLSAKHVIDVKGTGFNANTQLYEESTTPYKFRVKESTTPIALGLILGGGWESQKANFFFGVDVRYVFDLTPTEMTDASNENIINPSYQNTFSGQNHTLQLFLTFGNKLKRK